MATRRKYTSKRKKQTLIGPKSFKWILGLFLLLCTIVFVYKKKDMFLFYLGFKTKNTELTENQRKLEDKRINDIVANHEGKILGIDVSQYQGTIDWENLEAIEEQFEIKFVVVRATAGSKKVDRNFKKNWRNLSSTVYIQGAYHYYRPDENSTDQANNFIKNVKLRKGHLPPILDIEKMPKGQSMDKLKEGLLNWLTLVEKQYGVKPIIYTGEKYFEDFLQEDFPNYKFWIANYNPWKEKIEDEYLMWQFTEKAQLHGINELVDVNVFNGNVEDLKNVCIK
ncbi:GH25 family lysozyme [Flavobacterium sp.]|jgi:lysozyme|uniref:GH25 family lysozyme n=1 Tax=Flavobacterium sp. TaxID=239 RepID=UPI0037BE3DD3